MSQHWRRRIQRRLARVVCWRCGHKWIPDLSKRIDSVGRLWDYHDSCGRPYRFCCLRCGQLGRLPCRIESCSDDGPFPTVHQVSYSRYRNGGYGQRESLALSYAEWTPEERDHFRKCAKRLQAEEMGNVGRVAAIIRDEEEKALEVFKQIDRHAHQVIGKMGLSVETLRTLWDSRGWDPESVCAAIGKEAWYRANWPKETT